MHRSTIAVAAVAVANEGQPGWLAAAFAPVPYLLFSCLHAIHTFVVRLKRSALPEPGAS